MSQLNRPPLTVLYLAPSGQVGGAERSLLSLLACLDRDRYRPHVLLGSEGPLAEMLAAAGVSSELVPLPASMRRYSAYHENPSARAALAPWLRLPFYGRRLARAMRRHAPALVHSNGLKMHLLSAWLKPRVRAPLLWHLRDFPPRRGAALLGRLAHRADLAVANSQAVADAYANRFPALRTRPRVVHNGVDTRAFAGADGEGFRRRWSLDPRAIVIGMIAVFAPWKGHAVFLRAARLALDRDPSLRFLLVGDDVYDTAGHGAQRRELEAMARELGLGEALRFTGFVADGMPAAYAALDIAVHASIAPEPFGRTLIEAMAAGVALITTGLGGSAEIARPERDAVLVPAGDAGALAAAMLRLASSPTDRRRLAESARHRARALFSDTAHARAIEACYAQLTLADNSIASAAVAR